MALAGDLKQAFLQVRIREEDRDVMRLHWLKDLKTKQVEPLRFTRALFGLSTSPFLLGGVIDQHLRNLQQNFPNEVEEVRRSLYVDNLTKNNSNLCRFAISSHNCVMWRVVNSFLVKFASIERLIFGLRHSFRRSLSFFFFLQQIRLPLRFWMQWPLHTFHNC